MSAVSPEATVLFAAAGPPSQDSVIKSTVASSFDWDRLLWLATRERAIPILWRRFRDIDMQVPEEAAAAFQRQAMVAEFSAARLEARLGETLAALHAAEVEPVLLKGAALATTVYAKFRDRPMADLDLLIRPEEAERSRSIALECGWEQVGAYEAADYRLHHHLPPLVDPNGGGRLELHTGLFMAGSPFGELTESVRARSQSYPQGLGRVPADVHLVVHSCLHMAWSHVMLLGAWRTFYDLRSIIERERIDWDEVWSEAERLHATSCCYWVFRLANELAGIPVPSNVLNRFRSTGPALVQRVLTKHFMANLDTPDGACPSLSVWHTLWRSAIRPGRSGHGSSLPWADSVEVEEEVVPPLAGASPETPSRGLTHMLETGRYLTRLLTG